MEKVELDNSRITLYLEDCLAVMPKLPPKSVDMILADLPYGTTRNKWDSVLPLDVLWREYKRLRKSNAAIVLTAQTPFDKVLGVSNLEELKYEWIWEKSIPSGHLNAKKMPMKVHENVLIFYDKLPVYNPEMVQSDYKYLAVRKASGMKSSNYNNYAEDSIGSSDMRYPRDVFQIASIPRQHVLHPTQKPVALMEYLIKTYTNENDLVLDNTMGSGTTGIAAINTNRRFIGIEKDEKYFEIAFNRCKEAIEKKVLM